MNAGALHLAQVDHRRRHPTWVRVLFAVLFAVDVVPLAYLCVAGGLSRDAWSDPSYPPSFAVVCAATLVALGGVIGTRRGWHSLVLSLFGLVMVAWPLFVAWVMLNMLAAAL